jgi:limonene-1,2-epoxide hydrolase
LALDLEYLERHSHEKLRWKNPGIPAFGDRKRIIGLLKSIHRLHPGFKLIPVRHQQKGNKIIIDRDDVIPFSRNFIITVRVTGTFIIEDNKVVYWKDDVKLRDGLEAIKNAFSDWRQKVFGNNRSQL